MASMFSTKGRYALRIMGDLATHPGWVSLGDVAKRQGISRKYLEQVVSLMHKAGFVESLRGKGGGYRLTRDPSQYTLGAILRAAEGSLAPVDCLDSGQGHGLVPGQQDAAGHRGPDARARYHGHYGREARRSFLGAHAIARNSNASGAGPRSGRRRLLLAGLPLVRTVASRSCGLTYAPAPTAFMPQGTAAR